MSWIPSPPHQVWSLKLNKPTTEMKIMRFYYWGSWGVYSAQKDCHIILNFLYPPPSPSRKQPLRRYIHAFIWKSSNVHQTDQSRFLDEMAFLICVFKMFTKQRATLMYITCIVCTCTCMSKHKTTIVYFRLFLNL